MHTINSYIINISLRYGLDVWQTTVAPMYLVQPPLISGFLNTAITTLDYFTLCLKKTSHLYNLLQFLHTQLDCDNFWHKCCRESRQSKRTLFSHHI